MPHNPDFKLSIGGVDVTTKWDPILIQLEVRLSEDSASDNLTATLDDSGGKTVLPEKGAKVSCELGYSDTGTSLVFEGVIDEVGTGSDDDESGAAAHTKNHAQHIHEGSSKTHSKASRASGRTLTISANSADTTGKLKEPQEAHMDTAKFGDVASAWATKAGIGACSVHESLASIERPYWAIANESFWQWGSRIAREIGATFKVYPTNAVFVPRTGNVSGTGATLSGLTATWGVNLLDEAITPVISRTDFASFNTRTYDPHAAEWQSQPSGQGGIGSDAAAAAHVSRFKAPTAEQAQQQSAANAAESDRESGGGYVLVLGNPAAQPQAQCTVSGVRTGVDGTYTVADVVHTLNRASGYVTQMTLKQPGGGAGTDARTGDTAPAAGGVAAAEATPGYNGVPI